MATVYSKSFYVHGTGNGGDQLPIWEINGASQAPVHGVGVEPWESVSINIVGVGVSFFEKPANLQYVWIGNSFSPDLMLTMGYGVHDKEVFYPNGITFPFPASSANPPHIDAHVCANAGQSYQINVVLYYTKN